MKALCWSWWVDASSGPDVAFSNLQSQWSLSPPSVEATYLPVFPTLQ